MNSWIERAFQALQEPASRRSNAGSAMFWALFFPYSFRRIIIGRDMNPHFFITAAASALATVLVMLLVRWILYRIRTGRKLAELIGQDQFEYIIVDVRSASEYETSRITGARNLPAATLDGNLPTEKMFEPIYVYGRSWRQARRAARFLDETGYFNVTCYGGFRGWKGPKENGSNEDQL